MTRGNRVLVRILMLGMVTGASAAYVTDYQFNDAADTQVMSLANGGSDTNKFQWDNPAVVTDGLGHLAYLGNHFLRHDFYTSPIMSGVVIYELGISEWDLTTFASVPANANLEPAMFDLSASGGTFDDRLRLGFMIDGSGNVILRSAGVYIETNIGLSAADTDGIRFRQVVDLNNDTYVISYQRYSDGPYWTTWQSGTWGRGGLVGLKLLQGGGTWAASDKILFDYLTVDVQSNLVYQGEDWQMDEADGTGLSGLRNLTGTATWDGDQSDVFTTNGVLRFTGPHTDQAFRTSVVPAQSNGVFELKARYTAADLGTIAGALLGFGMNTETEDIFQLRLINQQGGLYLQYAMGENVNFGTVVSLNTADTVLTNALIARAVMDLDAGEVTFHYEYGAATGSVGPISFVAAGPISTRISMAANNYPAGWSSDAFVEVDYLILSPALPSATPWMLYSEWLETYSGMGSQTNQMDNPDGDRLNNLYEYALGGNPTVVDAGNEAVFQTVEETGINYLEYVYAKRTDSVGRGLDYYLEIATDLVLADWVNANYSELGTGSLNGEFDAVTNRVSAEVKTQQFIQLKVEFIP